MMAPERGRWHRLASESRFWVGTQEIGLCGVRDFGFLAGYPFARFSPKSAFFSPVDLDEDTILDDDIYTAERQAFKGIFNRVEFVEVVIHNATG